MKAVVINKKESVLYKGEVYRCGEIIADMDSAVFASLKERGYVQAADYTPEEENPVTGTQDGGNDPLEGKSYKELQKMAKEMGLDASGKKEELIERISDALFNIPFSDLGDDDEDPDDMPMTGMPE